MNRFLFIEDGRTDDHCILIADIIRVTLRQRIGHIKIYTRDRTYKVEVMDDITSLLWDEYKRIMLVINDGLPLSLPENFDESYYYQDNPDHAFWKTTTGDTPNV